MSAEETNRAILRDQDARSRALELHRYKGNIEDLLRPVPALYWLDFLASNVIGNALIALATRCESFSVPQLASMLGAAIFLFRAAIFVHEVGHVGQRLTGFPLTYDLVFGFLHKLPGYACSEHRHHHSPNTYGTLKDPEYEAFGKQAPAAALVGPAIALLLLPALLLVRFGVVPVLLPVVGKKGRNWIYVHASTLVMNFRYERALPTRDEARTWYLQDFGGFAYTATVFALLVFGVLPWKLVPVWYGVTYLLYLFNHFRSIVSHSYLSEMQATTYKQQILDSLTIPGSVLGAWLFPVGLRYHALHHMFPSMPYHNLAKAHARLLDVLPADHPYRRTIRESWFDAIRELARAQAEWQQARAREATSTAAVDRSF